MFLRGLSFVYDGVTRLRNYLYDNNILGHTDFSIPIISVGNLTAGGTGKTPVTDALVRHFLNQGKRPGIVSRGYGGQIKTIAEVDLGQGNPAKLFGDEPALLKTKHPSIPVYVGPRRVDVVEQMLNKEKVDLIIADDAFQHRALGRKINIVIVDAMESFKNYKLLPLGRARERVSSLSRADYIVINKANYVKPEELNELKLFLAQESGLSGLPKTFVGKYVPDKVIGENGESIDLSKKKVLLVSGIARPESFVKTVRELDIDIVDHCIFKDHVSYQQGHINRILDAAKEYAADIILTTEKDLVKLKHFDFPGIELLSLGLKLELSGPMEELSENTFSTSS